MSIVRIDNGSRHGWQARHFTVYPSYVSRYFSDEKFGSSSLSRMAAEAHAPKLRREAMKRRKLMRMFDQVPKLG